APGIVVLDADLQIESLTPEAEYWLDTLGRGNVTTAALPFPVYEVASRVQVLAAGSDPSSPPARLRVRSGNGEWLVLHGSRLTNPRQGASRTAIVIEAARSREVAPLVIRAYGFSPREQAVLERVLSGASTTETARALAISTYTVGDYLQAIFDRVGVRSQRELLAHFLGDPTNTDPSRASIAYGDATRRIIAN
ncbi:MAG TPA: LuxR C-terminal-related transcriptional regulator, partial [Thermomicrobiales bacterium]|nr:LuxR C-terminal-related transcriptional regulator [Thermomicrobiales bacterium]